MEIKLPTCTSTNWRTDASCTATLGLLPMDGPPMLTCSESVTTKAPLPPFQKRYSSATAARSNEEKKSTTVLLLRVHSSQNLPTGVCRYKLAVSLILILS